MQHKPKFRPFTLFIPEELNMLPRINSNDLQDLQGDLKDLSLPNYKRLRKSIKQFGFMVPLFVWFDPADGQAYTLDGNQRLRFVRHEYPEGVDLPYVPIAALDAFDAKARILAISSQYGEVTKDGFDEFVAQMPPEFHDFVTDLTTFGSFLDQIPEALPAEEPAEEVEQVKVVVTCRHELHREQLINWLLSEEGYVFAIE
ncbi:ParB N-terminal domain-containing protein [Spirosoma sordidisoli]|uniref:Uncharacterized protein n=1 Tax=Spirosoma sordidisoli TaxID=2502893 RepID=A0A4Q2UG56_9BACT|nr:hypothetical protein [Spirosoma sordidisoli]RYC66365.1 hypothetical protein EQG79_30290 [Spirosoma sordidisoli]